MNAKQVEVFEQTASQLEGIYVEISLLSKSKPNDAINKFKLKFVNAVLEAANTLLPGKLRPFADFSQFDENDIPSNSDVVFMLTQYRGNLEELRADNIKKEFGNWYWSVDGKISNMQTAPPKKLSSK